MPSVNLGPSTTTTVNTQSPYSTEVTIQTIAVTMTPAQLAASTSAEQSFGLNGVTFVTAATGIVAGDVIAGISAPSHVAGVVIGNVRVDPAVNDKFYVTFGNCTAGTPTPAAGVYLVTVARFSQSNRTNGVTLATMGLQTSVQ